MIKMDIKKLQDKFEENFLCFSAGWFWMLSILYILGGLVPNNYEMNFSFKDLLMSYVIANIISLTASFLLALIQMRKQDTSGTIRLPIDTPFEKLPPIFKNWNKQTFMLQLTKENFKQLSEDKAIKIPIKFYFPNKHNNYLANKMNLTLTITACEHKNSLLPIADDGGDMEEAPDGVDTFFQCSKCEIEILM